MRYNLDRLIYIYLHTNFMIEIYMDKSQICKYRGYVYIYIENSGRDTCVYILILKWYFNLDICREKETNGNSATKNGTKMDL